MIHPRIQAASDTFLEVLSWPDGKEQAHEYVNGDAHVNTLEGWFSLLKRGVMGTFYHVSEQHLDRYVDEFAFRYNNRKTTDAERAVKAIKKIEGKRLYYKEPTKK